MIDIRRFFTNAKGVYSYEDLSAWGCGVHWLPYSV